MDAGPIELRMTGLAHQFPSMQGAPGLTPWDASTLDQWAAGPASHGENVTARLLLAIWDPGHSWDAGRFDLMEALKVWDIDHREAFLKWARDPWWP